MAKAKGWRSRIVETGEVDPATLVPNPLNWRKHPPKQAAALSGVLDEIGFVQSVVVNRRTGRIIDGHARVELAISRGLPSIPVTWVDLTPADEAKALATFDPVGSLATIDAEKLREVIARANVEDGAVAAMLAKLTPAPAAPPAEVPITPEFLEHHDYVVLVFDNAVDWQAAQEVFGLRAVQSPDSKPGYQRRGIGRVVRGADVLRRLTGAGGQ